MKKPALPDNCWAQKKPWSPFNFGPRNWFVWRRDGDVLSIVAQGATLAEARKNARIKLGLLPATGEVR